ncbi:MAG: MFS transporter [Cyanomargarita calcarea GSE-NOS-MK-12-04C]|jgi:MFS family permease|uniref:MFS transporter n=1 Tax=Cyanomargarita calcarea GSE-NOS-MK-12-04C TaxID=2839659 RepID=A0A951QJI5_9CYAN|nr:MFS transporter [Cyanomargarita calcarea GSE-NOS-MK-12-04C]
MDFAQLEIAPKIAPDINQIPVSETALSTTLKSSQTVSKDAIRTSLWASTTDAIFATVFSITTTGILLSNFLIELGASPVAFGMLSSIPMLVNLVQPLGAYFSERTTSRFHYSLWTYGPSRLLWLILFFGIVGASWGFVNNQQLIILTLVIVLSSHLSGGLGSASWLSWLAMIVPRQLRGRYFGIRNSIASLTNLISVPLAGLAVSNWHGGTIQGYGLVLIVGILFGFLSLGCQYFKLDVNPIVQNTYVGVGNLNRKDIGMPDVKNLNLTPFEQILQDSNFLRFLLYFSFWTFAVNLSAPFFNLYMLGTLNLDISWVTLYSSLQAGANLLTMILWGKLADKIGNRPILISIGILVAFIPLLWLGIGNHQLDLWLWLPLLHILLGGAWAAIDLCNNNLQLGVAPIKNQSTYFAIAAAFSGASGALGITIGGLLAQFTQFGGLPGLFAISCVFRLFSLLPLIFVKEAGRGK